MNIYKYIFISIFFIIIAIYINYNLKINPEFQIINLSSNKINNNILYEKSPILVKDYISDIYHFINYFFSSKILCYHKYIINYKNNIYKNNSVYQSLSSYTIIYNYSSKNIFNIYLSHSNNLTKYNWKWKYIHNSSNIKSHLTSNYIIDNYNNINNANFIKIPLQPKQLIILPFKALYTFDHNDNPQYINIFIFGFFNSIIANILSF
jgi:hypothetical protein